MSRNGRTLGLRDSVDFDELSGNAGAVALEDGHVDAGGEAAAVPADLVHARWEGAGSDARDAPAGNVVKGERDVSAPGEGDLEHRFGAEGVWIAGHVDRRGHGQVLGGRGDDLHRRRVVDAHAQLGGELEVVEGFGEGGAAAV